MKEHIWQRNDTWERISAMYHVPICMVIRANRLERREIIHPGAKIQIPEPSYCQEQWERERKPCVGYGQLRYQPYTVVPGDSIYSIAKRFQTTMKLIMEKNSISDPRRIRPGQTLKIPCIGEGFLIYSVRTVDTLEKIAQQFHISADEVIQYNQIAAKQGIYPGMQLVIPQK